MWAVGDLETPDGRQLARDAVQFVVSDGGGGEDNNDYDDGDGDNDYDDDDDEDDDDDDDNDDDDDDYDDESFIRWMLLNLEGQRLLSNAPQVVITDDTTTNNVHVDKGDCKKKHNAYAVVTPLCKSSSPKSHVRKCL